MKVYLAGPMTGREHYNFKEFQIAKEQLGFQNHEVKTPFDADTIVWQRHFGRDFDPAVDKCEHGDSLMADMMLEDIKLLHWADAIFMLDGWTASKGTMFELAAAMLMGKKVFAQQIDGFKDITGGVDLRIVAERLYAY